MANLVPEPILAPTDCRLEYGVVIEEVCKRPTFQSRSSRKKRSPGVIINATEAATLPPHQILILFVFLVSMIRKMTSMTGLRFLNLVPLMEEDGKGKVWGCLRIACTGNPMGKTDAPGRTFKI